MFFSCLLIVKFQIEIDLIPTPSIVLSSPNWCLSLFKWFHIFLDLLGEKRLFECSSFLGYMVVFSLFLVGLFCLFFFSLSQEYQLLSRVCGRNFHYCPCSKDHQLLAAAVFKHFMCRIHNCSVAVSAVDRAQRNAWHCPSCPCCQVKLHKVIFRRLRPQCVSLMVDLGTVGCFFFPCSHLISQVCVSKSLWPL